MLCPTPTPHLTHASATLHLHHTAAAFPRAATAHASLHLTALELRRRRALADRACRPGGRCSAPSESVRPRVLLPPPPPLHQTPVCRESCFVHVYGCGLIPCQLSHLSLYL